VSYKQPSRHLRNIFRLNRVGPEEIPVLIDSMIDKDFDYVPNHKAFTSEGLDYFHRPLHLQ
jgi:hypothetical protein